MKVITYYTGRQREDGHREDLATRVTLEQYLLHKVGGFTRYDHHGGWLTDDSETVYEKGFTYEIIDKDSRLHAHDMQEIAYRIRSTFNQDTVIYVAHLGSGMLEYGEVH